MRTHAAGIGVVVAALIIGAGGLAAPAWAAHGAAQDRGTAKAGLLVASDFTPDWTENPTTKDLAVTLQKAMGAAGSACAPLAKVLKTGLGKSHASSSVFTSETASAQNADAVYSTPSDAGKAVDVFKTATTRKCLGKVLPKTLPAALADNPAAGNVASVSVTVSPGKTATIADTNTSYESTATIKLKSGKKKTAYVNTEAVAEGRALDLFQFVNVGSGQLDGIHDHLVSTSVGRLQGSLGLSPYGETDALASALTVVPGYVYAEATPDQLASILVFLSDPDISEFVNGESLHSIVQQSSGSGVGYIDLIEWKKQDAAQPGFKESVLSEWMNGAIEDSQGTGSITTTDGRPVAIVTAPTGNTGTFFFTKNILVSIFSGGADPAATAQFATAFMAASPI